MTGNLTVSGICGGRTDLSDDQQHASAHIQALGMNAEGRRVDFNAISERDSLIEQFKNKNMEAIREIFRKKTACPSCLRPLGESHISPCNHYFHKRSGEKLSRNCKCSKRPRTDGRVPRRRG